MGFPNVQDFNVDDVTDGISYNIHKRYIRDKINNCLLKKCVVAKVCFAVLSLMFYFF